MVVIIWSDVDIGGSAEMENPGALKAENLETYITTQMRWCSL